MRHGNDRHEWHGLSRTIPEGVKREVRRRAGFGCVLCGSAIVTYDHVDPVFADARHHDENRIALLCASCHLRKTKGLLSYETVLEAMRSPAAFRQGFAKGLFDEGTSVPDIHLGPLHIVGGTNVFRINNEVVLGFSHPEEDGAPVRLIARFIDRSSVERFTIVQNEFFANPHSWDIESSGQSINIRGSGADDHMVIEHIPRQALSIRRAHMNFGVWELLANERGVQLKRSGKNFLLLGPGRAFGPCLFDVSGSGDRFSSRNNTFEGRGQGSRFDMSENSEL